MLRIFIDGDACPVKEEAYRVAARYQLTVHIVAGSWMRTPDDPKVVLTVVGPGIDAADDWIVGQVENGDIVVTTDIPLAARCLTAGAQVLDSTGHRYTAENIGPALVHRSLLADLRDLGEISGGPPPFEKKHRSRFLQRLDEAVHTIRRRTGIGNPL